MEFWTTTTVLVVATLVYEAFAARRALRMAKSAGADTPEIRRDIFWLLFVAALLGSSVGRAADLGFVMAMIVVAFDVVFSFGAAAYVYDYRANWRSRGVRTFAQTAVDILRWGFGETMIIVGSIAVVRAVLDRIQGTWPFG